MKKQPIELILERTNSGSNNCNKGSGHYIENIYQRNRGQDNK